MKNYPDLVNIPFNNSFIKDFFSPGVPHYSSSQLDPGYWAILQDNKMILQVGEALPTLPFGKLPPGCNLQPILLRSAYGEAVPCGYSTLIPAV
jgi:hypothetical protein